MLACSNQIKQIVDIGSESTRQVLVNRDVMAPPDWALLACSLQPDGKRRMSTTSGLVQVVVCDFADLFIG